MRQDQRHRHIVKMKTVQDMALSDHNLKVIPIKMETVRRWRQGKPPHYTMGEASGRGNKTSGRKQGAISIPWTLG